MFNNQSGSGWVKMTPINEVWTGEETVFTWSVFSCEYSDSLWQIPATRPLHHIKHISVMPNQVTMTYALPHCHVAKTVARLSFNIAPSGHLIFCLMGDIFQTAGDHTYMFSNTAFFLVSWFYLLFPSFFVLSLTELQPHQRELDHIYSLWCFVTCPTWATLP